jgi:hypothetical protein
VQKVVQSELVRVCKVAISYDIINSSANPRGAYAHPQVCVAPPLIGTKFPPPLVMINLR